MSVTVKNPVITQKFQRLKKPPIQAMLNSVSSDLIKKSPGHRFTKSILNKKDSDTSGRIFVSDSVAAGSNVTEKQIAGFTHFGRGIVKPVKAKVLSFMIGAKRIFAMSVKATKGTYWWGLTDAMKQKAKEIFMKRGMK